MITQGAGNPVQECAKRLREAVAIVASISRFQNYGNGSSTIFIHIDYLNQFYATAHPHTYPA